MSGTASLHKDGEVYRVEGDLGFGTVTALYREARRVVEGSAFTVDLGGVQRADSAGLALLVEWTREAYALNRSVRFVNMPAQLKQIASVSGLDRILPLAPNDRED